jgi:hypothetical protein
MRLPLRALRRIRPVRPLLRLAAVTSIMLGSVWPARAVDAVIQPGEKAPPMALRDLDGRPRVLDAKTTGVTLLVFVKPSEKYTTATLGALDHMIAGVPQFRAALRRWIVVSRFDTPADVRRVAELAGRDWPVTADEGDRLYHAYKIIATPTLVVVTSGTVAAVHPGYDPAMEAVVRRKLADAMGIELPASMTDPPERPNMALQMGRRLAERGLWDRALEYYDQAAQSGPLGAHAQVEKASILTAIGRYDEAIEILTAIPADSTATTSATAALVRARALKAGEPAPTPPTVNK